MVGTTRPGASQLSDRSNNRGVEVIQNRILNSVASHTPKEHTRELLQLRIGGIFSMTCVFLDALISYPYSVKRRAAQVSIMKDTYNWRGFGFTSARDFVVLCCSHSLRMGFYWISRETFKFSVTSKSRIYGEERKIDLLEGDMIEISETILDNEVYDSAGDLWWQGKCIRTGQQGIFRKSSCEFSTPLDRSKFNYLRTKIRIIIFISYVLAAPLYSTGIIYSLDNSRSETLSLIVSRTLSMPLTLPTACFYGLSEWLENCIESRVFRFADKRCKPKLINEQLEAPKNALQCYFPSLFAITVASASTSLLLYPLETMLHSFYMKMMELPGENVTLIPGNLYSCYSGIQYLCKEYTIRFAILGTTSLCLNILSKSFTPLPNKKIE